jgi:hypothetical protein
MQIEEVINLVAAIAATEAARCRESARLLVAASQARAVRSWLDGIEMSITRQLVECDPQPEENLAKATRSARRRVDDLMRRGKTTKAAPELAQAMAAGEISGEHVDVVGRALAGATPDVAAGLLDQIDELMPIAAASNPDEFARAVRRRVHRLEADEGVSRLERQKRATRLRCWLDRDTGMWRLVGEFDPVSGALLQQRIDAGADRLFANEVPPNCPTDPSGKQDHLRALALLALTDPDRSAAGRLETVLVVDTRDLDDDGYPAVDWGIPIVAPFSAAKDYIARSRVRPVIVDGNCVVDAGGPLHLGRSQRVASAAQRRALVALYPTCAIKGCTVGFRHCAIHHVDWWRHGGKTDLDSLLPLCNRHHHRVHDDGWQLRLHPDRTLTVTLPDGTTFTTGPPRRHAA